MKKQVYYQCTQEVFNNRTFEDSYIGELFTEKEIAKRFPLNKFGFAFDRIELCPRQTYFFFGARFMINDLPSFEYFYEAFIDSFGFKTKKEIEKIYRQATDEYIRQICNNYLNSCIKSFYED